MAQQTQIEYPTDLFAPGAIDQLIAFHRQTFGGFRMEETGGDGGSGDGGDGGGAGDGGDSGDGDANDLGYPKDTPVSEMNADQRAAYFQDKATKEEKRRKGYSKALGGKTPEQIQADLNELAELKKGSQTPAQQAIEDAANKARAEERTKAGQRIAKVAFEGALSHLEKKDRDEVIGGLNLANYIDDDGEVDTDKVRNYAARIAPVDKTTHPPKKRNFGAGSRSEGSGKTGSSAGGGTTTDSKPRTWGR
jgi:ribosomal protein S30